MFVKPFAFSQIWDAFQQLNNITWRLFEWNNDFARIPNLQHSGQHFQGFALLRVEGHGPGIPQERTTLRTKIQNEIIL